MPGAPILRDVDIDGAWRSLAATRRDVASAYATLLLDRWQSRRVEHVDRRPRDLRPVGASKRISSVPSRARSFREPTPARTRRPTTTYGAAAAAAAALIASHIASILSSDETPGFLNRDGEPTSKLGVLACLAFGSGLLAATWHARGPRSYGSGRRRAPAGERGVAVPASVGGAAAAPLPRGYGPGSPRLSHP